MRLARQRGQTRGSYLETLEWVQDVLDDGQMETKAQMGAYAKKVSSEL